MRVSFALFCLGLAAFPARATDYFWNGGTGSYTTGSNWSPLGPPVTNAIIDATGANYTVTLSTNASIANLLLNSSSATFSHTAGTYTVVGGITLSAGTYSLNGGKISGGFLTNGGGTGKLVVSNNTSNELNNVQIAPGVLDLTAASGAILSGTTNFTAPTILSMGTNASIRLWLTGTLDNLTLTLGTNADVGVVNAGGNHIDFGATTTVKATGGASNIGVATTTQPLNNSGRLENTGAGSLGIKGGPLNNYGTIINSGTGTTTIGAVGYSSFNLPGGVIESAGVGGTVVLQTFTTNSGTVRVRPGAIVQLDGTFSASGLGSYDRGVTGTDGTVQNIGTMDMTGPLNLAATTGTMELYFGTINGNGYAITGSATAKIRPGNSASTYNIADNVQFGANSLDLTMSGGRFQLQGGSNFTVPVTTTMGDNFFLRVNQSQAIDNLNVTMPMSGANSFIVGISASGMRFTSSSSITVVNIGSGAGGCTIGYSLTASPVTLDCVLDNQRSPGSVGVFGFPLTVNGTIRNSGSGTTSINNNGGSQSMTVGTNGILEATAGTLSVGAGANLSNFSGGTLTGGTYRAVNNSTFTFNPGSITALGAATSVEIGGTATFTAMNNLASNAGTFILSSGKSYSVAPVSFSNTGTLKILGSGTFAIGNAISLTNYASNTLTNGTWVVGGTMDMGTRTIQTLATGTSVEFNGTTPSFPALTANLATNNGTLRNSAGSPVLTQSLTNGGLLDIAGGTFTIQGNLFNNSLANLSVAAGATLLVQGQFTNNGTYTVAGTMTTNNAGFLNGGTLLTTGTIGFGTTLDVNQATTLGSGTVNVTGLTTVNATLTVNPGVSFGGAGTVLVPNTRALIVNGDAAKPVTVQAGGTLSGGGSIGGPLTVNANGLLKPGNSPGLLTIRNNLILDGIYDFDLPANVDNTNGSGGTDFDQIGNTGGAGTTVVVGQSARVTVRAGALTQTNNLGNTPFWLANRTWTIAKGNNAVFSLQETSPGVPGVQALLFDSANNPLDYSSFGSFAFTIDNQGTPHTWNMNWQPVPEPKYLLLLGAGLAWAGRRKR